AGHCPACGRVVSPGPPPPPPWGQTGGPAAPPPGWEPAPGPQSQPWGYPGGQPPVPQAPPPQYPQPGPQSQPWGAPPWGGPNPGSGWAPPQSNSNVLSIIGIICGVISLVFLPILLGPAGIVLGIIAMNRHERLGRVALGVAIGGMVVGFILSFIVYSSQIG
ncbi:MAG: hypothetical protein ACYC1D_19435, partial [Acidimicrobiales bacterium]